MKKLFTPVILFTISITSLLSCNLIAKKKVQSPIGYDLSQPEKFLMPESLFEISGIAFKEGKSDSIFAIQDEEGKFFGLAWGVKKQSHTKFAKKGDYEDVAIVRGRVIVLKSSGTLFLFPFADRNFEEIDSTHEMKAKLPEGEYEAMYGDDSTNKLYVLCKNCKSDDQKKSITGYILTLTDSVSQVGTFAVDVEAMKNLATDKDKVKGEFRPSAMARNPVDGNWYIVSSVNKLIVVADKNWTIKQTIELNGNTFNQPEGIAFDNDGNMYISNEGDDLSQGNILKFARHKK